MAIFLIARKPTPTSNSRRTLPLSLSLSRKKTLPDTLSPVDLRILSWTLTYRSLWIAQRQTGNPLLVESLYKFLFLLQAFSKLGPVLNATIAKKKDPKKPGMCSITPAVGVIPVIICTVIAIVVRETSCSLFVDVSRREKISKLWKVVFLARQ